MAKNKTLSLRVQWLGNRLKKARHQAGYTLEEAGDYLQVRHVTLSRFENGIYRPKPSYVRDLVDFYGISDERERATLLQLNEDAWRKDVWIGNTEGLDVDFIDYTWLEARAAQVCAFSPMLLHGLLQTSDYARAVTNAGMSPTTPPETIDQMVEVRMTRQQLLTAEDPTDLSVVLEEKPLRREIGGSQVLKRQLDHLLTMGKKRNIDIRILPGSVGWHPGLNGPFTFFNMPDPYPDVGYFEGIIGRNFLEEENKVSLFRQAYDELHRQALGPRKSAEFIRTVLKELE